MLLSASEYRVLSGRVEPSVIAVEIFSVIVADWLFISSNVLAETNELPPRFSSSSINGVPKVSETSVVSIRSLEAFVPL